MSNLNEGVGKKIVEALKKQSEVELTNSQSLPQAEAEPDNLGIDVSALDEITNQGLMADDEDVIPDSFESEFEGLNNMYTEEPSVLQETQKETFNDFMNHAEKEHEAVTMPGNILVLRKLISQLPSGVTRHTGAQIIKQTVEALGISMKSVLTEAQEVQNNLKESSKECQMMIQEYKRKIINLEKQTQTYQKQYSALNDLISLFIQTTK